MNFIGNISAMGLEAKVYGGNKETIVYLLSSPMDGKEGPASAELLPELPCSIVSIGVPDWNADLTPWPAKRVFRRGEDFAGKGKEFLKAITEGIIPAAEQLLGAEAPERIISGGSLGGLFSVWALFECDKFSSAASTSGSMWYDGFCDFVRANQPKTPTRRLFLSLGDEEKLSTNKRFASVEDCTLEVLEIFKDRGTDALFLPEPGDHFTDHIGRLQRALEWTLR